MFGEFYYKFFITPFLILTFFLVYFYNISVYLI